MNGLAKWKMHHKDFISVLETNDLVCVTAQWLNKTESEFYNNNNNNNNNLYSYSRYTYRITIVHNNKV